MTVSQLQSLAKLPSRPVLLTKLVTALAGPMNNIARVLNASIQGLVNALHQVQQSKEK